MCMYDYLLPIPTGFTRRFLLKNVPKTYYITFSPTWPFATSHLNSISTPRPLLPLLLLLSSPPFLFLLHHSSSSSDVVCLKTTFNAILKTTLAYFRGWIGMSPSLLISYSLHLFHQSFHHPHHFLLWFPHPFLPLSSFPAPLPFLLIPLPFTLPPASLWLLPSDDLCVFSLLLKIPSSFSGLHPFLLPPSFSQIFFHIPRACISIPFPFKTPSLTPFSILPPFPSLSDYFLSLISAVLLALCPTIQVPASKLTTRDPQHLYFSPIPSLFLIHHQPITLLCFSTNLSTSCSLLRIFLPPLSLLHLYCPSFYARCCQSTQLRIHPSFALL